VGVQADWQGSGGTAFLGLAIPEAVVDRGESGMLGLATSSSPLPHRSRSATRVTRWNCLMCLRLSLLYRTPSVTRATGRRTRSSTLLIDSSPPSVASTDALMFTSSHPSGSAS
jgi:hypothetical protein